MKPLRHSAKPSHPPGPICTPEIHAQTRFSATTHIHPHATLKTSPERIHEAARAFHGIPHDIPSRSHPPPPSPATAGRGTVRTHPPQPPRPTVGRGEKSVWKTEKTAGLSHRADHIGGGWGHGGMGLTTHAHYATNTPAHHHTRENTRESRHRHRTRAETPPTMRTHPVPDATPHTPPRATHTCDTRLNHPHPPAFYSASMPVRTHHSRMRENTNGCPTTHPHAETTCLRRAACADTYIPMRNEAPRNGFRTSRFGMTPNRRIPHPRKKITRTPSMPCAHDTRFAGDSDSQLERRRTSTGTGSPFRSLCEDTDGTHTTPSGTRQKHEPLRNFTGHEEKPHSHEPAPMHRRTPEHGSSPRHW